MQVINAIFAVEKQPNKYCVACSPPDIGGKAIEARASPKFAQSY